MWIRYSSDDDKGEIGYKGGGGVRINVGDNSKVAKRLEGKEGEADKAEMEGWVDQRLHLPKMAR